MTIKKNLTIITAAAMIAAGSMAYAQEPGADEQPAAEHAVSQVRVKGVIEKTDDGVTLSDGETTYALKGEKDFSAYIGKTVLVAGEGVSSDHGSEILVQQIVEIK